MVTHPGTQLKTIYGTQRQIRDGIDSLVAERRPVFDVTVKHVFLFWYTAVIRTDSALQGRKR